jgi:hypothetical protein
VYINGVVSIQVSYKQKRLSVGILSSYCPESHR